MIRSSFRWILAASFLFAFGMTFPDPSVLAEETNGSWVQQVRLKEFSGEKIIEARMQFLPWEGQPEGRSAVLVSIESGWLGSESYAAFFETAKEQDPQLQSVEWVYLIASTDIPVFREGRRLSRVDYAEPRELERVDFAKWVSASCVGEMPIRESEEERAGRRAREKACARRIFAEARSPVELPVRVFGSLSRFFDFDFWTLPQLIGVYLYGILFSLLPSGLILFAGQRKLREFSDFSRRLVWVLAPLMLGAGLILFSFYLQNILGESSNPWPYRGFVPSLLGIPALFSALAFVPIWLIGEKRLNPESSSFSMRQLSVLYFFAPLVIQVVSLAVGGLRTKPAKKEKKHAGNTTSGVATAPSAPMQGEGGKFGGGGASGGY